MTTITEKELEQARGIVRGHFVLMEEISLSPSDEKLAGAIAQAIADARATPPLEQPGEYERGFKEGVEAAAKVADRFWKRLDALNTQDAQVVKQIVVGICALTPPQPGSQEDKNQGRHL